MSFGEMAIRWVDMYACRISASFVPGTPAPYQAVHRTIRSTADMREPRLGPCGEPVRPSSLRRFRAQASSSS
jgi:hypothetical protein